jgi:hypothetical protein
MPVFPRVLIHLVGLHRVVVQRQRVGRLKRGLLDAVSQLQQVLTMLLQLAGEPRGGLAVRDTPQDEHDFRGAAVGFVEGRAGEVVEHPAAVGAAVVQDRGRGAAGEPSGRRARHTVGRPGHRDEEDRPAFCSRRPRP